MERKCFNPEKVVHVGTDKELHSVVSNDLGKRILICGECVEYYTPCKRCDLCDALCFGPTLQIAEGPTVLKPCSLGNEVFCYNCVGEQLPEFMCVFFMENPEEIDEVFTEYYMINETRLDFSTPDTIVLEWNGRQVRRGVENKMSQFCHAMYEISLYSPRIARFLSEVFIPEMRARRYDECCYVQTIRQQRIAEGLETLAHFVPASLGHPRAPELLPSRYVRAGTPHILRRIRERNDFDALLDFLRDT